MDLGNLGIICDFKHNRHPLFLNYYFGISEVVGSPRVISSVTQLKGITTLFIGDDHYAVHKEIWMNDTFINYCNEHKIFVFAMTNEKTLNSFFPWNEDILKNLNRFKHLFHAMSDVDDCIALKTPLNRMALAKSLCPTFYNLPKKDKIIFIGNTKSKSYAERRGVIDKLRKIMPVDVFEPNIPRWHDYMELIAGYRFVFSPIGNANFFPMRFYEILAVNSIPIHQVRENTLTHYDVEGKFDDCIFFENVDELPMKLKNFKLKESHNKFYMEDNIRLLIEQL